MTRQTISRRGLVTLRDLGVREICARVVHRLAAEGALGRYATIANGPGFAPALLTTETDALTSDSFTHRLISLPTVLLDVPVTSGAEFSFIHGLRLRV